MKIQRNVLVIAIIIALLSVGGAMYFFPGIFPIFVRCHKVEVVSGVRKAECKWLLFRCQAPYDKEGCPCPHGESKCDLD